MRAERCLGFYEVSSLLKLTDLYFSLDGLKFEAGGISIIRTSRHLMS
jgi:hypothetical protein